MSVVDVYIRSLTVTPKNLVWVDGEQHDYVKVLTLDNNRDATPDDVQSSNRDVIKSEFEAASARCEPSTVRVQHIGSFSVDKDAERVEIMTGGEGKAFTRRFVITGEYQERYDLRNNGGSEVLMDGAL